MFQFTAQTFLHCILLWLLYLCYVAWKGYVRQPDTLLHWWNLAGIKDKSKHVLWSIEQETVFLTQLSVLLDNTY